MPLSIYSTYCSKKWDYSSEKNKFPWSVQFNGKITIGKIIGNRSSTGYMLEYKKKKHPTWPMWFSG